MHRRASATVDVQVSMMPDLSQDISTEQTTWEEILQIKAMPVSMAQKKDMKAKILVSPSAHCKSEKFRESSFISQRGNILSSLSANASQVF